MAPYNQPRIGELGQRCQGGSKDWPASRLVTFGRNGGPYSRRYSHQRKDLTARQLGLNSSFDAALRSRELTAIASPISFWFHMSASIAPEFASGLFGGLSASWASNEITQLMVDAYADAKLPPKRRKTKSAPMFGAVHG